jgi:hypothetical protein
MTDKPHSRRVLTFFKWLFVAILLYPLAICPLAFLHGAGLLSDNAIASIRPIYAPIRNTPAVWLFAALDTRFDALGRRFHKK